MEERFVKAIQFKDVQKGDVVCFWTDCLLEVSEVEVHPDHVVLHAKDASGGPPGGKLPGSPEEFIGLLHRPWPEGKTERYMLHEISAKAYEFNEAAEEGDVERARAVAQSLREAIEAWELSKPFDEAQGEPLEPEKK